MVRHALNQGRLFGDPFGFAGIVPRHGGHGAVATKD